MGNLPPGRLVEVYKERMKIEQSFKDTKGLLNIEKVMSKRRGQLEITLALVLLAAYGLGL
jgi:transposase